MFSLDTQRSEIANALTLPKIVGLLEDIIGSKLDLRVCKGAYKYDDGQFCNEVSFLIKADSDELSQKIHQYVRENTRQESVLVINKFNDAALFYADTWKNIVELGQWKLVDREVALQAFAHTRIGDNWYVASKPDEKIVDEAKAALLSHKISKSVTETIGGLELSFFDNNLIQWTSDLEDFDTRIQVSEGYPSGVYRLSVQTYFGFLKKTDTVSVDLFERINSKLVDLLRFSLNLKIESKADHPNYWLCSICFDSTEEFFVASKANEIVIQVMLTAGEARNLLSGPFFFDIAKPEKTEEVA